MLLFFVVRQVDRVEGPVGRGHVADEGPRGLGLKDRGGLSSSNLGSGVCVTVCVCFRGGKLRGDGGHGVLSGGLADHRGHGGGDGGVLSIGSCRAAAARTTTTTASGPSLSGNAAAIGITTIGGAIVVGRHFDPLSLHDDVNVEGALQNCKWRRSNNA